MAEKDREFTGALFFNLTNCPECGTSVSREDVEDNLSDDAQTFTCPHCHKQIDIGQLE
jgi:endogenous inhibitor of DNA gyrase (YacG/DUF329 family)